MDEYDVGRRLVILCSPVAPDGTPSDSSAEEQEIEVEIIQSFPPFTMSVVCVVRPISPMSPVLLLPNTVLLKLYDRRHRRNPRVSHDEGRPYSVAKEEAFQVYLRNTAPTPPDDPGSILSIIQAGGEGAFEAFLQRDCEADFKAEVDAYRALKSLQGELIPTLYARVSYIPPVTLQTLHLPQYSVSGIITEYIPSITLKQFLANAMSATLPNYEFIASVCESALSVVKRLDRTSLLNSDVRLDNILVEFNGKKVRCLATDFACSRLRRPDESDDQWRRVKSLEDKKDHLGLLYWQNSAD